MLVNAPCLSIPPRDLRQRRQDSALCPVSLSNSPLSNGDSIKIREMTSISVGISGEEPHVEEEAAVAIVDVGSDAPARNGGRGRARSKKAAASAKVPKMDEILDAMVVEDSAEASKNAVVVEAYIEGFFS